MKKTIFILLLSATVLVQAMGQGRGKNKRPPATDQEVVLRNAMQINTAHMEFAPVRYQNGIVYVTSREKYGFRDENSGETFYELYYADLDPDGMPIRPQPFSVTLNSPMHENSVAFNREGDRIFFTRNNMVNGLTRADSKGIIRMKIYEAKRGNFDWEKVREMPFNSDEYSCVHPTLSPDGAKLFFSSDMPGGYGGFDLWFVLREGDSWSDPINLGSRVNTTGNEVFPFMHESDMLFFSSDGYRGEGGLDLYMIDLGGARWGDVIGLGAPFNSPGDDLSLILDSEGHHGFFASNREGGFGKDDIYAFEAPAGIRGIKAREKRPTLFAVMDGETSRQLGGADIRVFKQGADGYADNEALYDVQLVPSAGNSDSLVLKYVLKSEEALGPPQAVTDRLGQVWMDLEVGQAYLVVASKPGYRTRQFSHLIEDEEKREAFLNLKLEPDHCLDLRGNLVNQTDGRPVGNATIRIVNETTGEVIVLESKGDGSFEHCLTIGCDFTLLAGRNGFREATTTFTTARLRGSRSLLIELSLTPDANAVFNGPIREGSVIVLEDIFYDFNKSAIPTRETRALEGLVYLMEQHSSMEIELGAHTDSRGVNEYNLKLSLKRAEAAKNYLIEQGIAPHRINYFGYGERKPRNHCVDGVTCTEEEHQYNRRTEVKITRLQEPAAIDYRGRRDNSLWSKGGGGSPR